jgi:branched-subunit amino acid transport protein AzlD
MAVLQLQQIVENKLTLGKVINPSLFTVLIAMLFKRSAWQVKHHGRPTHNAISFAS